MSLKLAQDFGIVPLEYAEWNDDKGKNDTWNYDQILSALTDAQVEELNNIIKAYNEE